MNNTIITKTELFNKIQEYKATSFYAFVNSILYGQNEHFLCESEINFLNFLINGKNFEKEFTDIEYIITEALKNFFEFSKRKFRIKKSKEMKLKQLLKNNIHEHMNSLFSIFGGYDESNKLKKSRKEAFFMEHPRDFKNDSILDFIILTIINCKINESSYLEFIKIVENRELNNLDKIYLSYLGPYELSNFINIIFMFLNKINYNETIYINGEKRKKRDRFLHFFQNFLNSDLIDGHVLFESYKYYSYIHFITNDSLSAKMGIEKGKHKSSHYIQGAYLTKIIGTTGYVNNKEKPINFSKTGAENPYCKYYFYKEALTTSKDSIEEKFSIIENKFVSVNDKKYSYLDFLIHSINNIENDNTFFNKSMEFHEELKLIFMINFVRSSLFLDEAIQGYYSFNRNNVEKIAPMMMNPPEQAFFVRFHTVIGVLRSVQYALVEYLLDVLNGEIKIEDDKQFHTYFKMHLKEVEYGNAFINLWLNNDYISIIFCIINMFIISKGYIFKIKEVNLTSFSNGFFIPKVIGHNSQLLFEKTHLINIAYFPIANNKLFVIIKENNEFAMKQFKELDSQCMLNLPSIPFIVSKQRN